MSPTLSFPILRPRDEHESLNSTTPSNSTVPDPKPTQKPQDHGGGFPSFLIAIIVIGAIAGLAFLAFVLFRRRAAHSRTFGSAPAGPSLDGAKKGLSALWYKVKNPRARSSSAGFEGISAGPRAANARGRALDPDEAWDTRMGREADGYYDETELQSGYKGAGGYTAPTEYTTAKMPLENPFGDEHAATAPKPGENPFGDEHGVVPSLRSISPRPEIDTRLPGEAGRPGGPPSPTRKALFKENV